MSTRPLVVLSILWLTLGSAPVAAQTVVFVEALFDGQTQGMSTIDGLDGARAVVVSPDGEHVYVGGSTDDAVAAFGRDGTTGELTWIEAEVDGSGGVDGLDGVETLAISQDGATLYVGGLLDNELAVFSRNDMSGALTYVETHADGGLSGVHSVVVSPDDENVYAAGRNADALVVYTRDPGDGTLTHLETHVDGTGGVDGLAGVTSVAVSPDGKHVYATGQDEQEVAIFTRSSLDGSLAFSAVVADGIGVGSDVDIDDKRVVRLDPSGSHLYVTNHVEDPADVWIAVFSRNSGSGALTAGSSVSAAAVDLCFLGIEGDSGIAFSPDGAAAYVNQPFDTSVVSFARDSGSGALDFADGLCDDSIGQGAGGTADGFWGSQDLAVSPDGEHLYVAGANLEDAVSVFSIACLASDTETVSDETIANETRTVQACSGITLGPDLYLDSGADLTVRTSGPVEFVAPVQVLDGASLTVVNAPPE
ncbi:MAG: beta-propeller fold lactonase family protein [Acidobacteriota bacterium]|jgi:6-phosphogluconolactonase (cycloisomerase 2 family)